ncbi:MAG: tRNA preQ1(34) S-adenosylmethionine ribosyltransferase-isomerase QueA [Polyangiaceae bacterium]|nr:tRNA preQ1(34) S-adenosylmethionine ribosyltransferase-isomerase QueA [Polyangiaceae bacterium]
MRLDRLDYHLPPELIASRPEPERDAARLLVVPPGEGDVDHRRVRDLPDLLPSGALLVVNDTRVVPARLIGKKAGSGGAVEIFVVRPRDAAVATGAEQCVLAMGRASKPLRPGTRVLFNDGALTAEVEGRDGASGLLIVRLIARDGDVASVISALGHMPLPPYMRRDDDDADRERYQTVYARVPGAVAAPTAGLHFTEPLFDRLAERGITRAAITLHVGLGTFQPVTADDLNDHPMHTETFVVPPETVQAVSLARARGAPVVAVGTTAVRALESAADPDRPGHVKAMSADTKLLIQPGFAFRVVDRLITNFHLPRSTLLALVYAFAGEDRMRRAYELAIQHNYRFYSYGDAMLLTRTQFNVAPTDARP